MHVSGSVLDLPLLPSMRFRYICVGSYVADQGIPNLISFSDCTPFVFFSVVWIVISQPKVHIGSEAPAHKVLYPRTVCLPCCRRSGSVRLFPKGILRFRLLGLVPYIPIGKLRHFIKK